LAFTYMRANKLEEALTLYEELEDQFYKLNGLERKDKSSDEADSPPGGASPELAGDPDSTRHRATST
jgi:hypothetical protein